jgi:hypothetical protein
MSPKLEEINDWAPVEPKDPVDLNTVTDWQAVSEPAKTVYMEDRNQVVSVPQQFTGRQTEYKVATDVDKRDKADYFGMIDLGQGFAKMAAGNFLSMAVEAGVASGMSIDDPKDAVANVALGGARVAATVPSTIGLLGKEMGMTSAFSKTIDLLLPDIPFLPKSNLPGEIDQRIQAESQKLYDWNQEAVNNWKLKPTGNTEQSQFFFDLGAGTASVAESMALSLVTKNPALVATIFGLQEKAQVFEESLTAGKMPEEASAISSMTGLSQGLLEGIGSKVIIQMAKIHKPFQRMIARITENTVEETLQQIAEEGITRPTGVRKADFMEAVKGVGYAGLLGALTGIGPSAMASFVESKMSQEFQAAGLTKEQSQKLIATVTEKTMKDEELISEITDILSSEATHLNITPEEKAKVVQKAQELMNPTGPKTPEEVKQGRVDFLVREQENILKQIDLLEEQKLLLQTPDDANRITYYRGGPSSEMPRGMTAQDILTYEQEDLGNADVKSEPGVDLKAIRSENLVWVTVDAKSAREYGKAVPQQYPFARVIARDSQGGVLLDISPPSTPGKVTKALTNIEAQQAKLAKAYDVMDSQLGELATDDNIILEDSARIELTLRQQLKMVAQSIKEGAEQGLGEVEGVQSTITDLINQSGLPAKDRAKFITTIKNTQTFAELDKMLPDMVSRIQNLRTVNQVEQLKTQIKGLLASTAPLRRGKRPIGKFDADTQLLLDAVRKISKMTKAEATSALNEKMASMGSEPMGADSALETRLLSIFGGLEEKNPSALREALGELTMIVQASKESISEQKLMEAAKRKALVDSVKSLVQGTKPVKQTDEPAGVLDRLKQYGTTFSKSFTGWDELLDMMLVDNPNLVAEKSILEQLRVARVESAEKGGQRVASELVARVAKAAYGITSEGKLLRQMQEDAVAEDLGVFKDASGKDVRLLMSKNEARQVRMLLQDPSLDEAIRSEKGGLWSRMGQINGWTKEMSKKIDEFLGAKSDIEEGLLKFYQVYYDRVNDKYRRDYGIDLPLNEHYSPIRRKMMDKAPAQTFFDEQRYRASLMPGSLKSRERNFHPIMIEDIWHVNQRHIVEMEHYLAWSDKIKDLNAVFGNAEMRQILQQKFGHTFAKLIDSFMVDFTQGGPEKKAAFENVLDLMRTNFTVSVLAKPAIALKQISSMMTFLEFVSPAEMLEGFQDLAKDPKAALALLNTSEFLKARGDTLTRDIKDAVHAPSLDLLSEPVWLQVMKFSQNPTWRNAMLAMTRLGDRTAVVLGGYAVYKKAIKAGATHEQAIAKFEDAANATQQSGDLSQLSEMQRANSAAKLLTMFSSWQNQMMRREVHTWRNMLAGRISKKDAMKIIFLYHFFIPAVTQFISDGFKWKDKEQLRSAVWGSMNGFFILSDNLQAATRGLFGLAAQTKDIPVFDMIQNLYKPLKEYGEAVDFMDFLDATNTLLKESGGPALGLPVKYANSVFAGVEDITAGELGRGVLEVLGWPKSALEEE